MAAFYGETLQMQNHLGLQNEGKLYTNERCNIRLDDITSHFCVFRFPLAASFRSGHKSSAQLYPPHSLTRYEPHDYRSCSVLINASDYIQTT